MNKNNFIRKDYMVYKPKYFLLCLECTPIGINVKNKLKEFEYNTKND